MTELHVKFRQDRPVSCGGCGAKFVPPDGPVLGVDDRMEEIWPVVVCPGCGHTVACSSAHALEMTIK